MWEKDQGCRSGKGKYQLEIKLSLWLRWVFGWRQMNRVSEGTAGRVGPPKVQCCPSLFQLFCLLSILLLMLLFFLPLLFLMNKVRTHSILLSSYIFISLSLKKQKPPPPSYLSLKLTLGVSQLFESLGYQLLRKESTQKL